MKTPPILLPTFRAVRRAGASAVVAITAAIACVGAGSGKPAADSEGLAGDRAQPGNDLQLFILFGQSNTEGAAAAEPEDKTINERVFVLGFDADDKCLGRKWNEWSVAQPPLHRCFAGLGPGDWFAKTLADTWGDAQVGLVPNAISGVDIDFFRKGVVSTRRKEFEIPPDNQRQGAYEMMVERAKLAQERGRIRGVLFHQGESDTGKMEWLDKVAEVVADLRSDLALDAAAVPFIAGELPHDGCCSSHNPIIHQLPERIPNAHVVSAKGLGLKDRFHFDAAGQREMGKRYAAAFLNASENPPAVGPMPAEAAADQRAAP